MGDPGDIILNNPPGPPRPPQPPKPPPPKKEKVVLLNLVVILSELELTSSFIKSYLLRR